MAERADQLLKEEEELKDLTVHTEEWFGKCHPPH